MGAKPPSVADLITKENRDRYEFVMMKPGTKKSTLVLLNVTATMHVSAKRT